MVFGQLAVGGAFLLSLPSLETVGLGFFRTNGMVFLITILLGLFLFPIPLSEVFGWSGAVLLFFSLFALLLFVYNLRLWFRHPHHSRPLLWTATSAGVLAILSSVSYYLPPLAGPLRAACLFVYVVV